MQARLVLGTLLLALFVCVVLWDRTSYRSSPAPGGSAPRVEESPGDRPALRGRDGATALEGDDPTGSTVDATTTVLEGRVVTLDGDPVPGVVVRVMNSYIPPQVVARVPADDEGRFRWDDASPGQLRLHVAGRGWVSQRGVDGPASVSVEVRNGRGTHVLLVAVPAATAFGRITDEEGRSVAGAEIRAWLPAPTRGGLGALLGRLGGARSAPLALATANEDGAYRLTGLEDGGEYVLEATSPTHRPTRSPAFRARIEDPQRVDLVIREGRWVEVTLRTVEGRPIPGARVWAHESGGSPFILRPRSEPVHTDAAGRVRLGPFSFVPVEVSVHVFGFLTDSEREAPPRVVPVGRDSIEIRLERGNTITGRLVDAEGVPVAGANVQAQRREVHENGYSISGFEWAETAADGSFRITGLPEGLLTLQAETFEPPIRETTLEVQSGSRDVRMVFGPDSRSGLELVILDPDGHPVPRASVEFGVFAPREVVGGRIHLAQVSSIHPEERTEIRVFDPLDDEGNPLPYGEAVVTWARGEPPVLEVRLELEDVLRGVVLGPDGSGLPGSVVVVSPTDGSRQRTVQTTADGSFEVRGLGASGCTLDVRVTGDLIPPPTQEVGPGDERIVLQVRAGVRPILTVLDPEGEPVAGAAVFVFAVEEAALEQSLVMLFGMEQRTLTDGSLRLPTLDPDATHRLRVEPPDDRSDLGGLVVEPWRPAGDHLRLPAALTVTGVVRDLDGVAVPHAAVRVEVGDLSIRTTWADGQGVFEVRGLSRGAVRLRARLPVQWVTGEMLYLGAEVEVQAGAQGVVLEGDAGASLTVEVEDGSSGGDTLEALLIPETGSAPRRVHHGQGAGEGRLRFFGLTKGARYTLWIAPSASSPDASLWLAGVSPSEDVLRARRVPGRTVEGSVETPGGSQGISVRAVYGVVDHDADVRRDRTFTLRGLPDLPWVIEANAWSPAGALFGSEQLVPNTPLRITLHPVEPDDR